jgi:glycosyltransferase involved in cell wall biosynthesis
MIRRLANDAALCNRLGTAAAEAARQYTWERNAQQMRELFERAAQRNSRR